MKLRVGLLFLCGLMFGACQAPPTKSFDQQPVKDKAGIELTAKTVILDARPAFDYSMAHLHGAVNMRWEDFTQAESPYRGLLEVDLFFLTRRLARYGIGPATPVVVVGRGRSGDGEEGRLAWTLKVLGVQDVQFATLDSFSLSLTKDEPPPKEAAPMWKPVLDDSLRVDKNTFLNASMSKTPKREQYVIIDVRSESQYLGKDKNSPYPKAPDIGAINIPWDQFFDAHDRVLPTMSAQLEQVGIAKDKTVYVIDNVGARSAAVTLALRELGYSKSANYAGGYMELLTSKAH